MTYSFVSFAKSSCRRPAEGLHRDDLGQRLRPAGPSAGEGHTAYKGGWLTGRDSGKTVPLVSSCHRSSSEMMSIRRGRLSAGLTFSHTGNEADGVLLVRPWSDWRESLENLGLARYAYLHIREITPETGGTVLGEFVRFHSASMVMFAQSAIQLAALWLNEGFNLGLIRNNIAFHRKEYQRAAAARIQGFDAFFDRHAVAISRIWDYRVGWFHHALAGPPRIPIERLTIRYRGASMAYQSIRASRDSAIPRSASQRSRPARHGTAVSGSTNFMILRN